MSYDLHKCTSNPNYETFWVPGGYNEKEAAILQHLERGYTPAPEACWQTCVFGSGYWVTMVPPKPAPKVDGASQEITHLKEEVKQWINVATDMSAHCMVLEKHLKEVRLELTNLRTGQEQAIRRVEALTEEILRRNSGRQAVVAVDAALVRRHEG